MRAVGLGRQPAAIWFDARLALLGAAAAALAGYTLVSRSTLAAAAICALPVVALLIARPAIALVLLGASLPLLQSLTGEQGLKVSASDLLLALLTAAILVQAAVTGSFPALRALRPLAVPLGLYCGYMVVLLAAHPGANEVVQTAQRFELFLIPILVGAFAVQLGRETAVVGAYVLATTAVALAWPLGLLELNKNPTGQLIGNAILLVVGFRPLHRFYPCLVVLVPGLFLTQSRGAVIATAVGLVVLLVWQGMSVRVLVTRLVPLAVIAAVAFVFMPSATQDRLTTLRAGQDSRAAYAIKIREDLSRDASRIIDENPWTGVGIGNYGKAAGAADPHQVLKLQAAEGGYVLAALFVLLIAGSAFALYRLRSIPIAPVAAAIVLSIAVHGLVDVYWVRGTPLPGWLLAGIALGAAARKRVGESA